MLNRVIRCLVFFFFLVEIANAQQLQYAIQLKDETIGILSVKRFLRPARAEFLIESNIQVHKLIDMDITYRISTVFENGKLIHSTATQTANGRTNVNTTTKWDGRSYVVITQSSRTKLRETMIDFNLCSMYFSEPLNKKVIWSDSFGKWLPVKALGNHRYELSLPDGKKNFYQYSYGICSMVETEQLFSKVTFLLKGP